MKTLHWSKVFTFAGAIVAYLIGSGFASGQEAMQFLSAHGFWGCLGAVIMTACIYFGFCSSIMSDGYNLQLSSPNDIFQYYCGKHLGLFFEIYTPIFLFCVYIVMLAGAGAILNEYYGISLLWGRIGMALLSIVTVLMGLNGLVNVVSKIGPCIILFSVLVGVGSIILNPTGLWEADVILKNITVTKATPNWFISGLIFPSMGCVMITPFLAKLGATASSRKEAKAGGIAGALTFALAVSVFAFGLLANIGSLYDKNVPALVIANQILPFIGAIFAIILIGGVYTTAVPMLWLSCNRLFEDEKSKQFRICAVVLTVVAFILSRFPFAILVNVLYTITGYLGILLVFCIFKKQITNHKEKLFNKQQ